MGLSGVETPLAAVLYLNTVRLEGGVIALTQGHAARRLGKMCRPFVVSLFHARVVVVVVLSLLAGTLDLVRTVKHALSIISYPLFV
jgi:hypothetical protein